MNIHQKLRLHTIGRWGMVNTTRPQSVAEHSLNVAVIAEELRERLNIEPEFKLHIRWYAVEHDMMEVLTGDIPSPTKMGQGLKWAPFVESLDKEEYNNIHSVSPLVRHVVKCADYMEAIYYLHMYGVGSHARQVIKWLETKLEAWILRAREKYPKYDWGISQELLEEIRERS